MEYSVIKVLMERDDMSSKQAKELVMDLRRRVIINGEDPEEILYNELGLEPDYIFDLIY